MNYDVLTRYSHVFLKTAEDEATGAESPVAIMDEVTNVTNFNGTNDIVENDTAIENDTTSLVNDNAYGPLTDEMKKSLGNNEGFRKDFIVNESDEMLIKRYLSEFNDLKFDFELLREMNSPEYYISVLKDRGIIRLINDSKGSSRNAYDLNNGYVLKEAYNSAGLYQNHLEDEFSKLNSPYLANISDVDSKGRYVVMEKVSDKFSNQSDLFGAFGIPKDQIDNIRMWLRTPENTAPLEHSSLSQNGKNFVRHLMHLSGLGLISGDLIKPEHWGRINGKIKFYDYGLDEKGKTAYYIRLDRKKANVDEKDIIKRFLIQDVDSPYLEEDAEDIKKIGYNPEIIRKYNSEVTEAIDLSEKPKLSKNERERLSYLLEFLNGKGLDFNELLARTVSVQAKELSVEHIKNFIREPDIDTYRKMFSMLGVNGEKILENKDKIMEIFRLSDIRQHDNTQEQSKKMEELLKEVADTGIERIIPNHSRVLNKRKGIPLLDEDKVKRVRDLSNNDMRTIRSYVRMSFLYSFS